MDVGGKDKNKSIDTSNSGNGRTVDSPFVSREGASLEILPMAAKLSSINEDGNRKGLSVDTSTAEQRKLFIDPLAGNQKGFSSESLGGKQEDSSDDTFPTKLEEPSLDALRQGKKEAIAWLVDNHADRLLKAATLIIGEQYWAEDAVQDCFVDAIRYLAGFRGDSSLYTWLYTILLRCCSRIKKEKRKQQVGQTVSPISDGVLYKKGYYSTNPPVAERKTLCNAIKSLSYRYREAIVLYYYEEFSIKEIALLLAIPEGTVKNRLYRARKKLTNILGREEGLWT